MLPSSGNVTTALSTVTGIINNRGNITTGATTITPWQSLKFACQSMMLATGSQLSSTKVYFTHTDPLQSSTPLDIYIT